MKLAVIENMWLLLKKPFECSYLNKEKGKPNQPAFLLHIIFHWGFSEDGRAFCSWNFLVRNKNIVIWILRHFQSRNLQVCLLFIGVSGKALTQVWLCLLDYDNSVNCQGLLWNKFFKGNLVFKKYSNQVLSLCFHRFLIASSSYGPWNRFLKSIEVESNR